LLGPGCAPERPAIAHHAGGLIVDRGREQRAPIPCATQTGFRTSEVSVAIGNDGAILFNPAITENGALGILRSEDQGQSWHYVPHAPSAIPVPYAIDQNLWVDRPTGRTLWLSIDLPSPTPPRLDYSDDGGKSWVAAHQPCPNRAFGALGCGHPQVFSGPPTRGVKPLLHGFPDVVYVCGGGANPLACQKSLDGGNTWGPAVTIPTPLGVSCPGFTNFGLNGVVGRDGTVYVPFTPCQQPYVAISYDAGETWHLSRVANTETLGYGMLPLGIDKQGNLYVGWVGGADRLPYLSVSRDGARHWSTPLMIGAPGVNEAAIPELVAGARGQVAVSYYASKNAPGPPFPLSCGGLSVGCPGYQHETWDTYVTESFNALDQQPVFWSATLNDPAQPTWYGCTPSAIGVVTAPGSINPCTALATAMGPTLGGRVDYFGAAMAPDGTPWVGFIQECPAGLPVPGNRNCPSTLTGSNLDALFGLVGRLVRPERDED
jgi:hypothetical protein